MSTVSLSGFSFTGFTGPVSRQDSHSSLFPLLWSAAAAKISPQLLSAFSCCCPWGLPIVRGLGVAAGLGGEESGGRFAAPPMQRHPSRDPASPRHPHRPAGGPQARPAARSAGFSAAHLHVGQASFWPGCHRHYGLVPPQL